MRPVNENKGRQAARAVARFVRWHPIVVTIAVLAGPLRLLVAPGLIVAGVALAGAAGGVWWWKRPEAFCRLVWWRMVASYRREVIYWQWRNRMWLNGLATNCNGKEVVPKLGKLTCTAVSARVQVKIPSGQTQYTWADKDLALAETFGALEARVEHPGPHQIVLELIYRRDIPEVPAFAIPDTPNLKRLPIGRRSDGKVWYLNLPAIIHWLIAGETGSGKGGVIWSLIRALAGGIRSGLVQIWACDPKGGMELGHGPISRAGRPLCPMFNRFAVEPAEIVALVEAALELVAKRARAMAAAGQRKYQPSTEIPTVVVIVDELAAMTSFATQRDLERFRKAVGLLLTQGRAVGVHLVLATHDATKSAVKVRDLIPHRTGLRMADTDQVDAALGRLAWVKGAHCEEIPKDAPGCGYEFDDATGEPVWVRASWVSDDDIADMAAIYHDPQRVAQARLCRQLVAAFGALYTPLSGRGGVRDIRTAPSRAETERRARLARQPAGATSGGTDQ